MYNGVEVSEPFLLYHHEISLIGDTSGVLTCRVESSYPVWRDVGPTELTSSSFPYRSTQFVSGIRQLSRTGARIYYHNHHNGLWSCIQGDRGAFGFIGIYHAGRVYTL